MITSWSPIGYLFLLVSFAYMFLFHKMFPIFVGIMESNDIFLQTFWKGCWTPTWFTRCCGGVYGLNENLTCLKLHPWKLTWNQKISQLKRKIIFQTSIVVFHVNFPGRKTVFVLLGELFLPEISIVVVNLVTTWEFPVPWKVLQKDNSQRILL